MTRRTFIGTLAAVAGALGLRRKESRADRLHREASEQVAAMRKKWRHLPYLDVTTMFDKSRRLIPNPDYDPLAPPPQSC